MRTLLTNEYRDGVLAVRAKLRSVYTGAVSGYRLEARLLDARQEVAGETTADGVSVEQDGETDVFMEIPVAVAAVGTIAMPLLAALGAHILSVFYYW